MSELLCPICGKNVQSVNVTPDCQHTSREIFEYIYSIKAELDEMIAELKQMGDYADELFSDCATFLNERDALRKNLDIAVDKFREIDFWAKAYPLDVFPEPDFRRVRELLEAGGITLDSVSASNMRHVINGVANIVSETLKELEG